MRTTDSLKLHSYAKVNLTLEVCGLRADGFHDIDSVVTVINLRDDIEVTTANAGVIDVVVAYGLAPSGPDNIVYRAADAFFDATGIQGGARLALHKHIPMMAGLGGGSGNAATAIAALNRLYCAELSQEEMCAIGAKVGSDVPLFIVGGTLRMRGRGEMIEPLPDAPELHLVIVKPDAGVSTAWAYAELDKVERKRGATSGAAEQAIRAGDRASLLGSLSNDFQPVVFTASSDIAGCERKLIDAGAEATLMCGSGASVFGVFASAEQAEAAARVLRGGFELVSVARTLTRAESTLVEQI